MDQLWLHEGDDLPSDVSSLQGDDESNDGEREGGQFSASEAEVLSQRYFAHEHIASLPTPREVFMGMESASEEDLEDEEAVGLHSSAETDESSPIIAEIFRCFICLGKVVDAQLCPCCSKICCLVCIKRWLTDQRPQCPHCRATLRVSQLVNCRFMADISAEFERMQTRETDRATDKACGLHGSSLSYYCLTCSCGVCSDCAVFGEEHRGHSFERLGVTYERHVEAIRTEAVGLRKRLKELCALVSSVDKNIEAIHKAKNECAVELQLVFEGMQVRLDQQLKSKLLALLAQKGSMTQEVELLDAMLHELNKQLNSTPKSELISRSGHIQRMLQDIHKRPTSDFARTPVSAEFYSEVVPLWDSGEFVLRDFNKKLRKAATAASAAGPPDDPPSPGGSAGEVPFVGGSPDEGGPSNSLEVVYSQPIQAAGIVWRLKVYPNGNGVARGSYISVFLEMMHGGAEAAKYEYRVEMLHRQKPQQCVVREFASDFEVGECWGYNRFFRLDLLEREGYLSPEEDVVHLRFYVRAPTYAQQCRDLRRALAAIQSERTDAVTQVAVLRRAFADTLWWRRRRRAPGGSSSAQAEKPGSSQQWVEEEPAGPEHLSSAVKEAVREPERVSGLQDSEVPSTSRDSEQAGVLGSPEEGPSLVPSPEEALPEPRSPVDEQATTQEACPQEAVASSLPGGNQEDSGSLELDKDWTCSRSTVQEPPEPDSCAMPEEHVEEQENALASKGSPCAICRPRPVSALLSSNIDNCGSLESPNRSIDSLQQAQARGCHKPVKFAWSSKSLRLRWAPQQAREPVAEADGVAKESLPQVLSKIHSLDDYERLSAKQKDVLDECHSSETCAMPQ